MILIRYDLALGFPPLIFDRSFFPYKLYGDKFSVLSRLKWIALKMDEQERLAYERRQENLHYQAGMYHSTYELDKLEGSEEGWEKGREEGR